MRLIRFVGVALVAVSLGFAGLSPAAARGGHKPPRPVPPVTVPDGAPVINTTTWKAHSWMGDLFSDTNRIRFGIGSSTAASNVKLGQLAIPGSHDSGAYFVRDPAPECGGGFLNDLTPGTSKRWARTQHYDLYTQAELGVRSFDIRPYWDGHELRTCHTLDAASLDDVFTSTKTGHKGLNKFATEHPQEAMIINLSHFHTGANNGTGLWHKAMQELTAYLRKNVCKKADNPKLTNGIAGDVTLRGLRSREKNYVVLADNDYDLYDYLIEYGLSDCVFSTEKNISGGYAGEKESVPYAPGRHSSTNLWQGLSDEDICNGWAPFKTCDPGEGSEDGPTVRRATEHVLINKIKKRADDGKSLHETSYIWAYGIFGEFGNTDMRYIVGMDDASLILATEKKEMPAYETLRWNGVVKTTYLQAGLLPYAEDFISRLDVAAKSSGRGVNIVNMDAIGKSKATDEQFITPLMKINTTLFAS